MGWTLYGHTVMNSMQYPYYDSILTACDCYTPVQTVSVLVLVLEILRRIQTN